MRKEVLTEIQRGAEQLAMLCKNALAMADPRDSEPERILSEARRLQAEVEGYLSQGLTAVTQLQTIAQLLISHSELMRRTLQGEMASIQGTITMLIRRADEELAWKRRRTKTRG